MFTLAGFGTDSSLRSSMFGCAIQTQIRIENCLLNRFSNYIKMRRRGNTATEAGVGSGARDIHTISLTSTGGMADECKRFHSRLAELLVLKKGDDYATTISWIKAKLSFAIIFNSLNFDSKGFLEHASLTR